MSTFLFAASFQTLLNSNLDIASLVRRFNFGDVYNPDKSASDLVSDIKNSHNNYTEIASPPADGPVCLWRSYSWSTITFKLFHNKNSAGHLNTVVNLEASGLPLEWEWDTSSTGANMIYFLLAWAQNCAAGFLRWAEYLLSPYTCVYMATSTYTLHYEVGFFTEKMVIDLNASGYLIAKMHQSCKSNISIKQSCLFCCLQSPNVLGSI